MQLLATTIITSLFAITTYAWEGRGGVGDQCRCNLEVCPAEEVRGPCVKEGFETFEGEGSDEFFIGRWDCLTVETNSTCVFDYYSEAKPEGLSLEETGYREHTCIPLEDGLEQQLWTLRVECPEEPEEL